MISQTYTGIQSITICSSANVTIQKSDIFQIKISGDKAENVKVDRTENELSIEYEVLDSIDGNFTILNGSYVGRSVSIGDIKQNNTVISGNVIYGANNTTIHTSSGKRVQIVNGEVFVNGTQVETTESSPGQQNSYKEVEIEIFCPDGLTVDCIIDGMALLIAKPQFDCAKIEIKGSGSAKLQAKSARLNISGSGKIEYQSLGGKLKIRVSGSGDVSASGEYDDVEVSVSGSGKTETSGTVKGDYEVDVSGMGDVTHRGTIAGQKSKSISGMGSVHW